MNAFEQKYNEMKENWTKSFVSYCDNNLNSDIKASGKWLLVEKEYCWKINILGFSP